MHIKRDTFCASLFKARFQNIKMNLFKCWFFLFYNHFFYLLKELLRMFRGKRQKLFFVAAKKQSASGKNCKNQYHSLNSMTRIHISLSVILVRVAAKYNRLYVQVCHIRSNILVASNFCDTKRDMNMKNKCCYIMTSSQITSFS